MANRMMPRRPIEKNTVAKLDLTGCVFCALAIFDHVLIVYSNMVD